MKITSVHGLQKEIESVLIGESNIGTFNVDLNPNDSLTDVIANYMAKGIKSPELYRLMNKITMLGHGDNAGYKEVFISMPKTCKLIIAIPTFMTGKTFTYYLGNMDTIDARKTTMHERGDNKDIRTLWFYKLLDKANIIPRSFIVGALVTNDMGEKEYIANPHYIGLQDKEFQAGFIDNIVKTMDDKKRFNPNAFDVPRVSLDSKEHIEAILGLLGNDLDYYKKGYQEFLEQELSKRQTK